MAERTVKVHLKGDAKDLDAALAGSETAISKWEKRVKEADERLKQSFKAPKDPIKVPMEVDLLTAASMSKAKSQVQALAAKIQAKIPITADTDGLRGELAAKLAAVEKHLKIEIPATAEGRRNYERQLSNLLRDATVSTMAAIGPEAGKSLLSSIGDSLKKSGNNPYLVAGIAALAAAATPAIATAITGAMMTGLGGAAIAAGIAGAAQDSRVKAAASSFTAQLSTEFGSAASPFVQPVINGFGKIAEASRSVMPQLRSAFTMLAPTIDSLVRGVSGFIRNIIPGLSAGLRGAIPYLEMLALWLPELGRAVGDFFRILGKNSADGASSFMFLLSSITTALRIVAHLINALTTAFGGMLRLIPGMDQVLNGFAAVGGAALKAADGADAFTASTAKQSERSEILASTWGDLIAKGNDLAGIFDKLNGKNLNLFDAKRRSIQASQDLKIALEESKGAVEGESEAAQAAGEKLSGWIKGQQELIRATEEQAVAEGRLVTAKAEAGKVWEQSRQQMMQMLTLTGMGSAAAQDLTNKLLGIPGVTEAKVSTPGAQPAAYDVMTLDQKIRALQDKIVQVKQSGASDAQQQVQRLQNQINALEDRTVFINLQRRIQTNAFSMSAFDAGMRWGGVTEHARSGLLKEAKTFSGGPTRYAFAEPETGGEAFVPKRGNYGRSMSILSKAASWYGASVNPGGGRGGNTYITNITAPVGSSPAEIGAAVVGVITKYEESNGRGWRS